MFISLKTNLVGTRGKKMRPPLKVACNAGVFWRAIECDRVTKRAPSWIQTRKRLGERRDGVLGSGC